MMCKGLKRYLGHGGGNDVLWAGYHDDMQAPRGRERDNHRQLPFNHLMSFFIPRWKNHYWDLCISNVRLWPNKIKRTVGRLFAGGKMFRASA